MTQLEEYSGRLALVTGAGDGIGKMLATELANAGMIVCVQDIRAEAAQTAASEIGNNAFALDFDVSDREACIDGASALAQHGEDLALLWVNAGVGVGSPVLNGRPDIIEWAYAVNMFGFIWTCQAFVPLMVDKTKRHHVGFTASSAALTTPAGDFPLYSLTKHGSFSVADAISNELAAKEIDSTILCPGLFNSEIWNGAKARPDRFGGPKFMDPAVSAMWRKAKDPSVMWRSIAAKINAGGGLLTCDPESEYRDIRDAAKKRAEWIGDSIIAV